MTEFPTRKLANGITVREAGQGSPVLLLHGIGADSRLWCFQMEALAARHRVVAWDMPGFGQSRPLAEMTFAALVTRLHELIAEMALHRPILVGHSMGGMIALDYATKHPQSPAALVLFAMSPVVAGMEEKLRAEFIRAHLEPLEQGRSMAELNRRFVDTMTREGASKEGLALARTVMAEARPESYRQAVHCIAHFDDRASLPLLPMHVMLIAGEHDRNAPPKLMHKVAERVQHRREAVIEGAGSLAHVERPEAFNHHLLAFVDHVRNN